MLISVNPQHFLVVKASCRRVPSAEHIGKETFPYTDEYTMIYISARS